MGKRGDMWRVEYPDDTGPLHAPLDWPPRMEETPMVEDKDFVYVDLYGNEVAPDDPAAQTKFHPAELKALRKGGFFPKRDGAPVEDAADEPKPVLNSGIGAAADEDADEKPARAKK
jgi:hypothetical protein